MLSRKVRIQVVLFVVIALLAVGYVGVKYVGLQRYVGDGGYTVHMELPTSGGIFTNAEVTYRGVTVGRVGHMRLTRTGIEVDLDIDNGKPSIPTKLTAAVTDRSVIGEQYVDLEPHTDAGPYLHGGSTIARADTTIPPSTYKLLASVNGLLASVPTGSLRTVVDELGNSFQGTSQSLQRLIDSSSSFVTTANEHFPQTVALLDDGTTVLKTQQAESSSIRSFSTDLRSFATQLRSSDGDLDRLLQQAPSAALTTTKLINSLGTPLGVLLGNLTTTSQVFLANRGGLQELLSTAPHAIGIGSSILTAKGANIGLSVTFFDPLPCTSGYRGTQRRSALDITGGQPLNTSAGCTAPASSGSDVRGFASAPTGGGAVPSWLSSYAQSTTTGRQTASLAQLMGVGR